MSSKRTFQRPKSTDGANGYSEQVLTTEPVAVYYRQSTNAQVGNISTAIQTIDMVDELEHRGWQRDNIILIDADEGVSGMKRIDEREGMSELFELITERKIGAVACQDEDRLFRDMTQIQVNIFVDVCRKANVKVITPFFTYDFAHPLHGEFHARQFRFKCEMAAEYLKSYVLGRLAPARQRLLREGKWAGAHMPVGFMVDMRKYLPDGSANPDWRKFVPFEPYAQIVREYYRVFLECGGAIRLAMRRIRDQHLTFPDCKAPAGFKAVYKLKHRGDGYYLTRSNFVLLLTNPAYIGHWCYKGVVQRWNNHAPIVDNDTFSAAFNSLSRYTLTGEENADYRPAYQYVRPDTDKERTAERPLLSGLIFTQLDDGRRYHAGVIYSTRNNCYLYVLHTAEPEGNVRLWARRSAWVDQAVVSRFKQHLVATFNPEKWAKALENTERVVERDRRLKQVQLSAITEDMQNLVISLQTIKHPYLISEVENRYTQREQERDRLAAEIAALDLKKRNHISVEQAHALFERAITEWDTMPQDERRNVLGLFVECVEATEYNRSGDMTLLVQWQDGKTEKIRLWHKPHAAHWTREAVDSVLTLYDTGATQLEIAAALPDIKWYQIFNEIKKHRGLVRFTPRWLGNHETYSEYVASGGRKGKATGSYWREEELNTLRSMVERQATQLEIMQEFPYRRWIQLKHRIRVLFDVGVRVTLSGISQRLTYIEYVQQQSSGQSERSSVTVSNCTAHQRAADSTEESVQPQSDVISDCNSRIAARCS